MDNVKPKRGRPVKADKSNANIALRLRPEERSQIVKAAEQQRLSTNRFMVDAALAIVDMINGTKIEEPEIVAVGRFLRERENKRR